YAAEEGTGTATSGWTSGATANNVRFIRLGHVLLWRAEVAVEENDLATALNLVNQLRNRAKNGCWVQEGGDRDDGSHADNAANYDIEPYTSFPDQTYARKAVRFEMRLEFGMEGSRFFDLVRWGVAAQVINAYIAKEQVLQEYLAGSSFVAGKNEFYPIPQTQIDVLGSDVLKQNPGY
ncbi:MAG TPA: RagB/SusD family nutrient uptake outer membrane protein, partial [Cyclobacteriaceae bacterium]|nr:RagB/SusD family nutrient uptake outer membrane protein [Cyclobacteriaceae bacterium]